VTRPLLAALALAGLALAGGCGKSGPEREHRADWVIHSRLQFMSQGFEAPAPPLPRERFRLWFPFVSGDLYGAPTIAAFSHPVVDADYRFEIDLNEGHEDLVTALERTRFSGSWMSIAPAEARVARLSPLVLEADGIESLGVAEWVDEAQRRLMLVYFDRPASITGSVRARGHTLRFDVHAPGAGYVWIEQPPVETAAAPGRAAEARELVYKAVAPPKDVTLAIALGPQFVGNLRPAVAFRMSEASSCELHIESICR